MKDRNEMRDRLLQRMQSGGKVSLGIFKSGLTGINFWSPGDGQHMFDIIPYIAGPNDPNCKEGEGTYLLELFVHQNCGVKEGIKICLLETYGKKCPVCEDRIRRQRAGGEEGSEKIIKLLTPSRYPRTIYNVICYDTRQEEAKGIQVFHTSFYLLEMYLREMAKRAIRPGDRNVDPLVPFMDIEKGKTIVFKKEGERDKTKFIGIRFEDRDYDLDPNLISQAPQLDTLIDIPSYEDIMTWYYGEEAEESDGAFRGTGKNQPAEDVVSYRKPKREEDTPGKRKSETDCPSGYEFGAVDVYKECGRCEVWDACAKKAAADKAARIAKEADEEPPRRGRPADDDDQGGAGDSGKQKQSDQDEEPPRRRRPADDDDQGKDNPPARRRRM